MRYFLPFVLFFTLIFASPFASAQGIITTVAGNGDPGFSGDGGPATQAQLYYPSDVAVDNAGNLYIADNHTHRIRKADTNGVITTVAGIGPVAPAQGGYSGDGGPATQAQLYGPSGVAVDSAGNLYIGDEDNDRVRKVDTNGIITTVAGIGRRRPGGYSGDGGPATQAQLFGPVGVAADNAGNLYIADKGNHRVRKVDTNGIITTVAGTGTAGFSGDGGPATQAQLYSPMCITVDSAGNLYIGDAGNHRVRKVDASGTITTVAGTGTAGFSGDGGLATQAQLNEPWGVKVDSAGKLYIADLRNQRVRMVDTSGTITTVAGTGTAGFSGDGGPATQAQLQGPYNIAFDNVGNLYIADAGNHRIRKVIINREPAANCQDVTVSAGSACTADTSINHGSYDPDGDPITLSQSPEGPYSLGSTLVTLTAIDDQGASTSCSATVTVLDDQPPAIACPAPQTIECTGPSGALAFFTPLVSDNCGPIGASCTPPSGSTFPLGSTPISCSAMDGSGNSSSCGSGVTVADTTAPVISSVSANPNVLWPPNHKMVPVTVGVSAADVCDPGVGSSCQIISVTSNEPVNGLGAGDTAPDWAITGSLTVNLRAERSGTGGGREYTVTVKCTDASGNNSTKAATVIIPHDQRR